MPQPRLENRAKNRLVPIATPWRLKRSASALLLVVFAAFTNAQAENAVSFPSFRHVDATTEAAISPIGGQITLLADEDFAPWSFRAADGQLKGIAVELAAASCAEAGLTCTISAKPFAALLPALRGGEAQVVISGIRPDAATLAEFRISKPYFRALGRFMVRQGSSLPTPDIRTLAGKRLGYINNSSHARFVERYYSRSALTPFATPTELQEALRTGQIDVAFGDAMQEAFWLRGSDARGCCTFLGKAFVHRESFSRSLVFVGAKDQNDVVNALDHGLDLLDGKSVTASIFSHYLPSPIW